MFGLKKKKPELFTVVSPLTGKLISLDQVHDEVFSSKMMGDGFAIEPTSASNTVISPISGKIVALVESKHAVGIKNEATGIEILIHIGLDTVKLNGEGFDVLVRMDQEVKQGQPLIKFEQQVLKDHDLELTTMVIFTGGLNDAIDLGAKNDTDIHAGDLILRQVE